MGVVVHCCSKDKEEPTEVVSKREEEEKVDREIDMVKSKVVKEYKIHEEKIIYLQNFIRAFRFRREFSKTYQQEKEKINSYIVEHHMIVEDGIDFDSFMHPLVKKTYNNYLKRKDVFAAKELNENLHKFRSIDFLTEESVINTQSSNTRIKQIFTSNEANPFMPIANVDKKLNPIKTSKPIWLDKEKKVLYKGKWNLNLKPHGFGVLIKSDGSRFEGFFTDGRLHGYGRYFTIKGEFFEGQFKHGVASGYGLFIHPDGNIYKGDWHNDKTDGDGVEFFQDGSTFQGKFRNGKKNGRGIYLWIDGSSYDGYFKDDLLNGYGLYKWPDNSSYEGDWRNNLMNGKGVFVFSDGSKYEGDFINNKRSGHGKYIWNENKFHIGLWKDGKQHGKGKYYKEGKIIEGIWNEGKLINFKEVSS